jgi:1,4-dihydroxy-2-naphthoyl-CoA hydrolase
MSDEQEETSEPGGGEEGADGLGGTLGFTDYEHLAVDEAAMNLPVTPKVLQPYGIVHGGAYAALAESLTSRATYETVGPDNVAFGQTNDTSFLRPVFNGTVHAEGRARHRGSTTWVWDVEMRDDEDRLCAVSRVTIAVRPFRRR